MKWLLGALGLLAIVLVMLYPILESAGRVSSSRLHLYAWAIAVAIIVLGMAFPISSPRRVQSWAIAVLMFAAAVLFLAVATIRIAYWHFHS